MDKSPFNSPSPQDSPRLSSFTQHHRPVIAVHSGECHPWEARLPPAQPPKCCRFLNIGPTAEPSSQEKNYCGVVEMAGAG